MTYEENMHRQELSVERKKHIHIPISVRLLFILFILPFLNLQAQSESRQIISFNRGWKFYLGQVANANDPNHLMIRTGEA